VITIHFVFSNPVSSKHFEEDSVVVLSIVYSYFGFVIVLQNYLCMTRLDNNWDIF